MRLFFLLIFCIIILQLKCVSVEFIVSDFPELPKNPSIYLAGSFNSWNPGNEEFKLTKLANSYTITIELDSDIDIEYKFTRGNWESVEKGDKFEEISNRRAHVGNSPLVLTHNIQNWRNPSKESSSKESTASGNIIHYKDYFMPQLNRKRDLYIYLPPDYDSSKRHYPVIYMHDGQNLFDEATSFAGEWNIDETLERFYLEARFNGAIVVGICNHPQKRADEYSPWFNENYNNGSGGEGEKYVEFIVKTLKPWIDDNYRTLPDLSNTMMAGSSLGGLISLYAGCRYPGVFGKLGIFSPAFWFADPYIKEYIKSHPVIPNTKVYLDVGTNEGNTLQQQKAYLEDAKDIYNLLVKTGLPEDNIWFLIDEGARHHEGSWSRRFPEALIWLFN